MPTSYEVISLGNLAKIDTTQGNEVVENASGILGTYGSAGSPLSGQVQTLTANSLLEDDNNSYDLDNGGGYDTFAINGGAARNFDASAIYNAVITYTDGTTATITATVFQDVNGNTYLAPEDTANADQTALTAKPIQSLSLNSVASNTGDMAAERVAGDFMAPVDGTAGNDSMGVGYTDAQGDMITSGADAIYGGGGTDSVNAGDGGDLVFGGDGNDSLTGGYGNDSINAGSGDDWVTDEFSGNVAGGGADTVDLGDGNDTFVGSGQGNGDNDLVYGGLGADSIAARQGYDTVYGGDGNDTISTQDEDAQYGDALYGDAGDDIITGANTDDTLYGGTGSDQLFGGGNSDTLKGGDDNDSVFGGVGNDDLSGENGNDLVVGGDGNDWMFGNSGDDTMSGDAGTDTLYGGYGNDSMSGGADNDFLQAEFGNDTLDGGAGNDTLDGGDGDDRFLLNNSFGNDSIIGGEAAEVSGDLLDASAVTSNTTINFTGTEAGNITDGTSTATFSQIERVILGSGNDAVQAGGMTTAINVDAGAGNDQLSSGSGADTLSGGSGNDTLNAGDGNDVLDGGSGSDTILGGAGNDIILTRDGIDMVYAGSGDDTIDDSFGVSEGGTRLIYSGDGNDSALGGSGNDTVYGDAGNDSLSGEAGNDRLFGGTGSDTLSGDDGNDTLRGGDGADSLEGGSGNDMLDYSDASSSVFVDISSGYTGLAAAGDTIAGFEGLTGSAYNDTLQGRGDADTIYGGAGDDSIRARGGDDTVDAGAGNDLLEGNEGNDLLSGGDGNDTLDGGSGDDMLTGGAGSDSFAGGDGNDVVAGSAGNDTIATGLGNDTVILENVGGGEVVTDFNLTLVSDKTTDQLDVSDLLNASGNPVTWLDVTASDTNGDGTGDAILTFPNGESITLQGITADQVDGKHEMARMGIPCFAAGSPILTPSGPRAVETLARGDLVETQNGPAPVIWAGSRSLGPADLAANPDQLPIHFAAGAIGNSQPLRLSPQHAVQIVGADGLPVLVRAKHMAEAGLQGVRIVHGVKSVTYHHLMLERHSTLSAAGATVESMYPGPIALASFPVAARLAIAAAIIGSHRACKARVINLSDLSQIYGARCLPILGRKEALLACRADASLRPFVMKPRLPMPPDVSRDRPQPEKHKRTSGRFWRSGQLTVPLAI